MAKIFRILALASLAGCVSRPSLAPADADVPSQYSFVMAGDVASASEPSLMEGWWLLAFDDPLLHAIVGQSLQNNRSIDEAIAQLDAARAATSAATRALLPQGTTSFAYQRQQQAAAFFAINVPQTGDDPAPEFDIPALDIYTASADLSWEADLFGRLRAERGRAAMDAQAVAQTLADIERLTVSQAINAYLSWREATMRAEVAARNLETQQQTLNLTERAAAAGARSELDVERQRTQTRQTAAQLASLRGAEAEALSALALVMGLTVPDATAAFPPLTDASVLEPVEALAAEVPIPDPAVVLRQRPDVKAAELSLAATTFGKRAAVASLFPQLTLTGSRSLTSLTFDDLTADDAVGFAFGPRLSWSLFSYPQLLAQIDVADAQTRAALARYEQTVLQALTETDAALVQAQQAYVAASLTGEAFASADRARELADARYKVGAESLLSLLDAQRTALQAEDQAVSAQINAYRTRAAVFRAFGSR